jgi:cyclophilin family peptidyl-prolyl cis-trans isomerase
MLATVGCTEPPDPPGPYEGTCPILILCTAKSNNAALEADHLEWFGEDGSCWKAGPYQWGPCRDSCVTELASLNVDNLKLGIASCGECESDSECSEFEDASCVDGYCARKRLGDVSDGDTTETDTGTDTETDTGDETDGIHEDCKADTPTVVLDTSLGTMTVELDPAAAPEATQMFLLHLSAGYYDGSIIHRAVKGVLIQGGEFGPGPTLLDSSIEPIELLTPPALAHQPGVIALVPSYDGAHVRPQWYMTVGPTPPNTGTSGVVFGALTQGSSVLNAISNVPVTTVAWAGFVLTDFPEEDVVVHEAFCVPQ